MKRKRPLDTPKRKIERREREVKARGIERERVKGRGIERESDIGRHRERESEREKIERNRRFILQFLVKSTKRRIKA
jgi:hypothetical protein